jgi:hypothetical protein
VTGASHSIGLILRKQRAVSDAPAARRLPVIPERIGGGDKRRAKPMTSGGRRTSKKNPGKLANPTDCLPAAPAAQVSSPSDARENLETGSVAGIGRYLHDDVASLLKLIPKHRQQSGQQSTNPPGYDPDLEFEFDTADVAWAIENGLSGLVDDYLREVGKLMTLLGDMLDPQGRCEFQLKPVRRRRGKPKDHKRAFLEGKIHQDLKFARIRLGGKLEAAISEVSEKYNCSRATLLRVWKRYERTRSRT